MPIVYVTDLETMRAAYRAVRDSRVVSLDYETTGLDPHTDSLLLVQFGTDDMCYVVPVRPFVDHIRAVLELLTGRERLTLAHNASFEYQFTLANYGLHLGRLYDTMLAEAVLTAGLKEPLGLGEVASRRLGLDLDKTLQKSFIGADPDTFVATPEQVAYAAQDVLILPALMQQQRAALEAEGLLKVAALEFAALPVFAQMEYHGMKLDLTAHAAVLQQYKADAEHYGVQAAGVLDPFWQAVAERNRQHDTAEYDDLTARIANVLAPHGGRLKKDTPDDVRLCVAELRKERTKVKPKPEATLNLNSGQQVLAALAESGISLPNLQAETVEEYAHKSPVLQAYARYAKAQKVVSTYGDSMAARVNPETNRLHFGYKQMGTATGRTSSDGAQVMPPNIRACFIPEPGNVFVVADFAAMEMRIAAGLYQDPAMLAAFGEDKDLHKMTAAAAWPLRDKPYNTKQRVDSGPDRETTAYIETDGPPFYGFARWEDVPKDSEERAYAKIGNFASIYGASAAALEYQMGVPSVAAKAIIDGISSLYRVMWEGIHNDGEQALHTGYAITALGRKRYFYKLPPEPRDYTAKREWRNLRSRIVRQAMNHPVQGTGADIAKRSMVLIYNAVEREYREFLPGANEHSRAGRIVGMVHDELIIECPARLADKVKRVVNDAMQAAGAELIEGVAITVDVHVTERWEK